MQNEKRRPSWYTAIVAVICIILTVVLISNVIIIVKGTLNPERPPSVFGVTSMIVLTGSMSGDAPDHIEAGDMIVTKAVDPTTLKVGDVITYMENGKTTVTHRIIGINEDGTFKTKGDANNTEDKMAVPEDELVGIYKSRIPGAGNVAMFMQSTAGLVICVILPLILLVGYDIIRRRRYEKENQKDTAALLAELEALKAKKAEAEKTESNDSESK